MPSCFSLSLSDHCRFPYHPEPGTTAIADGLSSKGQIVSPGHCTHTLLLTPKTPETSPPLHFLTSVRFKHGNGPSFANYGIIGRPAVNDIRRSHHDRTHESLSA
ncbi:MAG TPA: hypothetical protein PLQ71_02255, partial [Nitrospira sp.]|nr:hypothetical protein [Nitrospira sp.]